MNLGKYVVCLLEVAVTLNNPEVTQRVIELTNKPPTDCCLLHRNCHVCSMAAMEKQTVCFKNSGVSVVALECFEDSIGKRDWANSKADIILVSSGNTLYAYDRWMQQFETTFNRGRQSRVCVGGSAGAICWFAAGHSDMDPSVMTR